MSNSNLSIDQKLKAIEIAKDLTIAYFQSRPIELSEKIKQQLEKTVAEKLHKLTLVNIFNEDIDSVKSLLKNYYNEITNLL